MASSSFVVKNYADTDVTFALQSQDAKLTKYIVAASSLSEPVGAEISHDLKPLGSAGTDRHLVKFFIGRKTSDGLRTDIEVGSLLLAVPRGAQFENVDALDIAAFIKNYLTEARILSIIDGITP